DVPCAALCNKALCERREFGVGSQSAPGAVFLPDNQTSILESAAEIYRRASDAQLLYLRGDRVAQVQDDAIELVERHQMRSIIERLGPTYSKQATRRGGYVARRSSVSAEQAAALLACEERQSLPE